MPVMLGITDTERETKRDKDIESKRERAGHRQNESAAQRGIRGRSFLDKGNCL